MRKSNLKRAVPPSRNRYIVKTPYIVLSVAFILSRVIYHFAGVRFDAWSDINPMHFVFPELLRSDLWRSLFCLHSQPPLFNLFIGIVIKLFPVSSTTVFSAIYFCLGLILSLSIYRLMTDLNVPEKTGITLTLLFIVSPAVILYENLLLYTYPVTVLLCLSSLMLYRFAQTQKMLYGLCFFGLLSIIVLTRSLFHFIWIIGIFALLISVFKEIRRKITYAAVVPLALVFLVYGKNLYFFGDFSTSSWLGASFAKMTTFMLSEKERFALAEEGMISELAFIPVFKGLWLYHDKARVPEFEKTGVPILDLEYWPSVGNNYNNLAFKSVCRQYLKDALVVVKKHPVAYLHGLQRSFTVYFFPSSDWFISRTVHYPELIIKLSRFYDKIFYGQFVNVTHDKLNTIDNYDEYVRNPRHVGFLIFLGYVIAVFYGISLLIREIKNKRMEPPYTVTVGFMILTVLYITMVSKLIRSI